MRKIYHFEEDLYIILKKSLYIVNLKYVHFTPIFRLHNIHLVFSTCPDKYKRILCSEKSVLNACLHDF